MSDRLKIIFPTAWETLKLANDIFHVIAMNASADNHTSHRIWVVLSEIFNNAYQYGENNVPNASIIFEMCFNKDKFVASIINEGTGFTDKNIKWNEFPSGDMESGRGLKIIKRLCEKVEFKNINGNKFGVFVEIKTGENKNVKC